MAGIDIITLAIAKGFSKELSDTIPKFKTEIVDELPDESEALSNTVYVLRNNADDGNDLYNEYIFLNGKYELLGTSNSSTQADWEQTDETKTDYIKNKPFGEIIELSRQYMIGNGTSLNGTIENRGLVQSLYNGTVSGSADFTTYETKHEYFTIEQNGNIFEFSCPSAPIVLGTITVTDSDSDEPKTCTINFVSNATTYAIEYYEEYTVVKKIDSKYIEQSNWDETDDSSSAFIQNKPFGDLEEKIDLSVENGSQLDIIIHWKMYGSYYTAVDEDMWGAIKVSDKTFSDLTFNDVIKANGSDSTISQQDNNYVQYNNVFYCNSNYLIENFKSHGDLSKSEMRYEYTFSSEPEDNYIYCLFMYSGIKNAPYDVEAYATIPYVKQIDKKYIPDTSETNSEILQDIMDTGIFTDVLASGNTVYTDDNGKVMVI